MPTRPSRRRLASRLGTISTRRFRLVPLSQRNAEEVRAVTDDPAITGAVSFLSTPFTEADARELIQQGLGERDCFLGIRDKRDGRLAGIVGAHLRDDGDVEVGYWIGSASHGQGIATEATGALVARLQRRLSDRRIIAECRPENRASWQVLAKVGFTATGTPGTRPGRHLLAYGGGPSRT